MRGFYVVLIGISIVCLANLSFAQGIEGVEGKLEAGAYGILVIPEKGNFDTAGGGGGYLRYYITENIAIEGAAEYAQWDFSTDVSGASGTLTGDLDVIPIMGTLLYCFPAAYHYNITSYIGGGITGMFIDGDATGTLTPGGTGKISFDDAIGGHICGGIDWKMTENIFFNLDAKYTWAVSETSESVDTGTLTFDDMDMYNATIRGGLSYKF